MIGFFEPFSNKDKESDLIDFDSFCSLTIQMSLCCHLVEEKDGFCIEEDGIEIFVTARWVLRARCHLIVKTQNQVEDEEEEPPPKKSSPAAP